MWHYHPSRGCSTRAPMTAGAGRAGHVMLALGRGLVVAGGLQPLWMGFGDQLLCELYDPTCDSWSSIPALPRPHLSPGATVLDGRLYVVGLLGLQQIQRGIPNGCIAMTPWRGAGKTWGLCHTHTQIWRLALCHFLTWLMRFEENPKELSLKKSYVLYCQQRTC